MKNRVQVGYTCPTINSVISKMESAINELNYLKRCPSEHIYDSTEEGISCLKDAIEEMEDIRRANSELRDWGNEECEEKNNLKDKLFDLELKCEYLEETADSQNREIEKLENEVYRLNQFEP